MKTLRLALAAAALSGVLACSDSDGPTQPIVPTPTQPAAASPTPTQPGSASPTPTPPVVSSPTPTPPVAASPTPTPSTTSHNVIVGSGGGNVFFDAQSGNATTTIQAGETVLWTWNNGPHSTTSGVCCTADGIWNSGTKNSGTFQHTFPSAGSFPYFCVVHGTMMTGTVVVNP
jgi:plastocyanin